MQAKNYGKSQQLFSFLPLYLIKPHKHTLERKRSIMSCRTKKPARITKKQRENNSKMETHKQKNKHTHTPRCSNAETKCFMK